MAGAIRSSTTLPASRTSVPDVGTAAACWSTLITLVILVGSATSAGPADRGSPADPTGPGWLWPVQAAAAGALLAACWLVRRPRSGASAGLALVNTGVLLPMAAGWSWLSPAVRAVILAAAPIAIAGSATAVLRWRHQPPPGVVGFCRAVLAFTLTGGVLLALGYNPFTDPRCELTCINAPTALAGVLSTRSVTMIACLCTVAAAVVGVVGIARLPCAPRLIRAAGIVTLTAFGMAWLVRWAPWSTTPLTDLERALPFFAALTIGGAVCWQVLGTLHRRAAAGRLVEQLSDPTTGPAGRGSILAIHFAARNATEWLDAQGCRAQPIANCKHVVLSDESGPVVCLALTRRADEFSVLSGLTPARRLALRNAQLVAVAKSHIAQVQESGQRLVAVSDAERQRIERDLHDGAQQRLVSASFHLKVARSLIGPAAAPREIDTADQRLLDTLGQLRAIAHGMFPTALIEEGLTAALEELVATAEIPATLVTHPTFDKGEPAGNGVAMATFATVNAALRAVIDPSAVARAHISITQDGDTLTAQIHLWSGGEPVDPNRLTDAADRVVAAGGQLTVSASASDQVVTAVIPCGW